MLFTSPGDLRAFTLKLLDDLASAGIADETTDRLRTVSNAAYTTGSEWLGDLGLAVRELQRRHKLQEEFEKHLETIMEAVHAAWPRL